MKFHGRQRRRLLQERLEARELPSSIAMILLAQQSNAAISHALYAMNHAATFPSPPSQTPGVTNLLLNPAGTPTSKESHRESYHASFTSTFSQGSGRFSTESSEIYLRGIGSTTDVLHADFQMRLILPTAQMVQQQQDAYQKAVQAGNPSPPPVPYATGEITVFDRNISTDSVLGLDLYAQSPQSFDRYGRPTHLEIYQLDSNVSAGKYVGGLATGSIDISYSHASGTKPPRGVNSQGTATVKISAQVYGLGTSAVLTNSDINP